MGKQEVGIPTLVSTGCTNDRAHDGKKRREEPHPDVSIPRLLSFGAEAEPLLLMVGTAYPGSLS